MGEKVILGFYLAHALLGIGFLGSALIAFILGAIILIIDRSFVATPKSSRGMGLEVLRFGFAVISTFLGSLALDLALFQGDIKEYQADLLTDLRSEAETKYKEKHQDELRRLEQLLHKLQEKEARLGVDHILEMTGKKGTGRYGKGDVSDAIERQKLAVATEAKRVMEALQVERSKLDQEAEDFAEEKYSKR